MGPSIHATLGLWSFACLAQVQCLITQSDPSRLVPDVIDPRNHYLMEENLLITANMSSAAINPFARRQTINEGPVKCGADTPCADGSCCGSMGICGFGETYCGNGCINGCDGKAPCGENSEGGEKYCGMNLCCSYYGWCGTSQDYCTTEGATPCQSGYGSCATRQPYMCDPAAKSSAKRTIGYYQGNNVYQRLCNKIPPDHIKLDGYSHLYWAFASIDPKTFATVPADSRDESLYAAFTDLSKSTKVKTWIAIGGFDFSDPGPTHTTWSDMVSTPANRQAFITGIIAFMNKHGFSGVDFDWEYPVDAKRGGQPNDMKNLVQLLADMRAHPKFAHNYGISVTLAPDLWYLQYFDAKGLLRSADWLNFMSYDLHGVWDQAVPTIGKKVLGHTLMKDIEKDVTPLWFDLSQADMDKVNFGLALYGRGYTLADPTCNKGDGSCYWTKGSKPGKCTNQEGIMSNYEIRNLIKEMNIVPVDMGLANMVSLNWDDQWLAYDDEQSIKEKKDYASGHCFGGTMAWSVDLDSGAGTSDSPPVSTDNRCSLYGFNPTVCPDGQCCSSSGYCGDTSDYCGSGCTSGNCTVGGITPDGTCGVGNRHFKCGGTDWIGCCSASGYCQLDFDCSGGEQKNYSSEDAGPVVAEDYTFANCDTVYNSVDDIISESSKIEDYCMNTYLAGALASTLDSALDSFEDLIKDGYDHKFDVYQKAVVETLEPAMYSFIFKNGGKYFDCQDVRDYSCCKDCNKNSGPFCFEGCTKGDDCVAGEHKRPNPCPTKKYVIDITKEGDESHDWWWSFKSDTAKNDFFNDLAAATGIDESWVNTDVTIESGTKTSVCTSANPDRDCFYHWTGWLTIKEQVSIPNPKEIIGDALNGNLSSLYEDLLNLVPDLRNGYADYNSEDYVDGAVIPVFMAQAAITSMQSVISTADKIEDAERKEMILGFVGAFLFLLPGIGQTAGELGFATLARLVFLVADVGDAATLLYGAVDDPKSLIFSLFGALFGGNKSFKDAAVVKRSLKDDDISALGAEVKTGIAKVDKVKTTCKW